MKQSILSFVYEYFENAAQESNPKAEKLKKIIMDIDTEEEARELNKQMMLSCIDILESHESQKSDDDEAKALAELFPKAEKIVVITKEVL